MLDLIAILLLSLAAALLNAHAARVSDRASARRARLEASWGALIAARRRNAR